MSLATVLLPLFVEVILTFALLFWAGALRSGDLRSQTVKPEDIALRELNWPKRTAQVSNAYSNQTELPTLFYILTLLGRLGPALSGNARCWRRLAPSAQ